MLNWLFKRDSAIDDSTELLIFITPRIIKASGQDYEAHAHRHSRILTAAAHRGGGVVRQRRPDRQLAGVSSWSTR